MQNNQLLSETSISDKAFVFLVEKLVIFRKTININKRHKPKYRRNYCHFFYLILVYRGFSVFMLKNIYSTSTFTPTQANKYTCDCIGNLHIRLNVKSFLTRTWIEKFQITLQYINNS